MYKKLGFKFWIPIILLVIAILSFIIVGIPSHISTNNVVGEWLNGSSKCDQFQSDPHCEEVPNVTVFAIISFTILFGPGQTILGAISMFLVTWWSEIIVSLLVYFLIGYLIDILKKS